MTPTDLHPTSYTTTEALDPMVALHRALPAVQVHRALRRELSLAGPLIRGAEVGDVRRARLLADHVDLLLALLHHHHELEDEVVWPMLRRGARHALPSVEDMEEQHREIERLARSIARNLPVWTTLAAAGVRNRLADELDALYERLVAHLDAEELVVLPLAEGHLTAAEWDRIGEEAERRRPAKDRVLAFGLLQHDGDPEVLASMLGSAPLPVRFLLPRLARRAYGRHARAVHERKP